MNLHVMVSSCVVVVALAWGAVAAPRTGDLGWLWGMDALAFDGRLPADEDYDSPKLGPLLSGSPYDLNNDEQVDQADFAHFQVCLGTSSGSTGCLNARLDADPDIDVDDFTIFLSCLSGPGVPAAAACRNP